tara:strand:+ start:259 stop:678 length:420 start_codon:yes stop_codon:yes gene_type:complete
MALKEINPRDITISRAFKDVSIGLGMNRFTNDLGVVKNDNAIKQAIKNLVLTNRGEKPFQMDKGSRVTAMLFEQLDAFTCDAVEGEIINTIEQYEPRVQLTGVKTVPIYEGNKIAVTVQYKIVGQPIVETINFVLQRPE